MNRILRTGCLAWVAMALAACPRPSSSSSSSSSSGGEVTSGSSSGGQVSSGSQGTSSRSSSGTATSHAGTSTATSSATSTTPSGSTGTSSSSESPSSSGCGDLTSPSHCGDCVHDCFAELVNFDPATVTCTSGVCGGSCAANFQDRDHDGKSCETYCFPTGLPETTCNGRDDNCDGRTDEDVDACALATCGGCGAPACVPGPHATSVECRADGNGACAAGTACKVTACTCNGPGDCWWDLDGVAANGCEHRCDRTNGGLEICDGLDNDCDGLVDAQDDLSSDPSLGMGCQGGPTGACADPSHTGVTACVGGTVACSGANVLFPGTLPETCNGQDDDCNGLTDDNPVDVAAAPPCGSSDVLPCHKGTAVCLNGGLSCSGNRDPAPETCDGVDNDCDGTPDNNLSPSETGLPCSVPLPPPSGAASACIAGLTTCFQGRIACGGAVLPAAGAVDSCGVDANCDGVLTNQPDLNNDVHNCQACGHDCGALGGHGVWGCTAGQCSFNGCQQGYYDIAGDHLCSYGCIFRSAAETCNGLDDNCDGQVDENVVPPTPIQVCGVQSSATNPECRAYAANTNPGGISVACVAGAWQCTFHTANVCSPSCASATEVCDVGGPALDNNCNGLVNENTPNFGQACASDTGLPAPGHGVCRTTGTYVCSTATATSCSAAIDLSRVSPEVCDGIDNDCDGSIDEPYSAPGTNRTYFVKPVVTRVTASLWIDTYEASRPSATAAVQGSGNGFTVAAPLGFTLDKTPSCSVPGHLPWFNVQGPEAEQVCASRGGHLCLPSEWTTACQAKANTCTWGYSPSGAACTTSFSPPAKACNLAASYDADPFTAGDQDAMLATASSSLAMCSADWAGVLGNTIGVNDQVFDLTGNLRELTGLNGQYTLLGGAFLSQSEEGAACNFTAYTVDSSFAYQDTGFRCCYSQDPSVFTCGNSVKDGTETDLDCGGLVCADCATGKSCLVGSDCVSGTCLNATHKCQ